MKKFLTTLSTAAVFFSAVGIANAQDANFDDITIQCNNGKYLSSENGDGAMSCDKDVVGDWEVFEVILIPSEGFILKASNGSIVRTSGSQQLLVASGNTNDSRTIFSWGFPSSDSATRTITRNSNAKLLNSRNGETPVTVTSVNAGRWETFTVNKVN